MKKISLTILSLLACAPAFAGFPDIRQVPHEIATNDFGQKYYKPNDNSFNLYEVKEDNLHVYMGTHKGLNYTAYISVMPDMIDSIAVIQDEKTAETFTSKTTMRVPEGAVFIFEEPAGTRSRLIFLKDDAGCFGGIMTFL